MVSGTQLCFKRYIILYYELYDYVFTRHLNKEIIYSDACVQMEIIQFYMAFSNKQQYTNKIKHTCRYNQI